MTTNVITVEAKLNGDAANMVAALKQATSALNQTKNASNEIGSKAMGVLKKGIGDAIGFVVKLGIAAAATGVAMGVAFAGEAIRSGITRVEALTTSTQALTKTLGSTTQAAKLTAAAVKVVSGTPLDVTSFTDAERKLIGFGESAQQIPGILKAIGDAAAVSGNGTANVSALTTAFGRMNIQGKVTSRTLLTLGSSGVQAQKILANALGVTTTQLGVMVSKGLIPASKAQTILINGIENGSKGINGSVKAIGGAAQDLAKTLQGSLGTLKETFTDMGASWVEPLTKGVPAIINSGIIPILQKLSILGAQMFTKLDNSGVENKLVSFLREVAKYVDPATSQFAGLVKTLSPFGAVLSALGKAWPKLQGPLTDIAGTIKETVVPEIAAIFKAMVPIVPIVGQLADAFSRGLGGALPGVTFALNAMFTVLTPIINAIDGLPTPVLALATALIGLQNAGLPMGSILADMAGGLLAIVKGIDDSGNAVPGFVSSLGSIKAAAGSGGAMGALGALGDFITGPWGLAIGGAVTILGILALSAMPQAAKNTDALAASFDNLTGSMTKNTRASVVNDLEKSGAFKAANTLHIPLKTLTDASLGNSKAQAAVRAATAAAQAGITSRTIAAHKSGISGGMSGSDINKSNAIRTITGEVGSQNTGVKNGAQTAKDTLQANNQAAKDVNTLTASYKAATKAISENGKTLDTTTIAGKANSDAVKKMSTDYQTLLVTEKNQGVSAAQMHANQTIAITDAAGLASKLGLSGQKATDFIAKMLKISTTDVHTTLMNSVTALEKQANQFGLTGAKADAYVAKLLGIPTSKVTAINIQTAAALAAIAKVKAQLAAIKGSNGSLHVGPNGLQYNYAGGLYENGVKHFATGGYAGARASMMANGGSNIMWAEKRTGWETYISGDPTMKQRSAALWAKTGQKLGLTGGGGSTGGVTELGPKAIGLLRAIAGKDTSLAIGDQVIANSAQRGTKQSVLAGRG